MILFCEKTDFLLRNKMVIKNWIANACKKETKVAETRQPQKVRKYYGSI